MTEVEAKDLFGPFEQNDEEKVTPEKRMGANAMGKPVFPCFSEVAHPSHYTAGKIECIDALESALVGLQGVKAFCTGNAIKYLWRWQHKGGVNDLKKAAWYIDRLVSYVESKDAD